MLKIRLMGTKNDIKWFSRILERNKKVNVLQISEPYANKGTNRYFRAYAEIENESEKQKEQREGTADAVTTV